MENYYLLHLCDIQHEVLNGQLELSEKHVMNSKGCCIKKYIYESL